MDLIVYADFSCPSCYLASRRADALVAAGVPIDWRTVEHALHVPVVGRRLNGLDQQEITDRFAALDALLLPGEQLPWSMPPIVPSSEAAVAAYAAVYGTSAAHDVRRLLFELYWTQGVDVGNPNALRTPLAGPALRSQVPIDAVRLSGYAVSVDRGPVTTAAYRRIRAWQAEWRELGVPQLPAVLAGGATLSGVDALRRLGKELAYVEADLDPVGAQARRYPEIGDRPSASWVSQIGGRWRTAYRPPATRGTAA
jgi:predicted DsbA family dithiol-disulfide isomerase